MSVTYGFFNASLVDGDYDRKYTADQLAEFFSYLLGNGVAANIENSFKVTPGSGLTVNVSAGFAWINGFWAKNDAVFPLTASAAPASGYRKDLVVLRFDRSERSITPMIIQGTASSTTPAPMPNYIRTVTYHDLVLASIDLKAGDSAVDSSMITDLRENEVYCGIVDTLANRLVPEGSIHTSQLADGAVTPEKLDLADGFNPDGPINLSLGTHYFNSEDDLPAAGNAGRLYFVKINS